MRALALLAALLVLAAPAAAQDTYQMPDPALAALVDAPPTPAVLLSPDRTTIALMGRPALPGIGELAEPELRLAGLRINPARLGPSRARSYDGIVFRELSTGAEMPVTDLPEDARVRNPTWSPDGQTLAFLVDHADRVELWTANTDGETARATSRAVNDALGRSAFAWMPDGGSIVVTLVPEGHGSVPGEPAAPSGPVIQENTGGEAPARTYQDLLEGPHDEAVFEHVMTSQLARIDLTTWDVTELGAPDLVVYAAPSPDGRYLLVETIHRPFSYLVPYYRFPLRAAVIDPASGDLVAEVFDNPLQENVPVGFGSVPTGPRSVAWRADADAQLFWVEALDGGDIRAEADERDRIVLLDAPFSGEPAELARLEHRFGGVLWGDDDTALAYARYWQDRLLQTYRLRPGSLASELIEERSYEDRYADPGRPMTAPDDRGQNRLILDGTAIYLTGQGASPEGNRPFVTRYDLASGSTTELFRSAAPYYEVPEAWLEVGETLLTRRETVTDPPNYMARDLASGTASAITAFPHPYPELADVQKIPLEYTRADGIPLTATLYLPAGYDADRDGPLPGLVWAYPREYRSADAAGQRSDSPYQFTRVSYWGAVPFVTQGYAVIDGASFPIVGEGDAEPNDSFRAQLVMNAEAAIQAGAQRGVLDPDRVAIGGHSYGAFMTANLLAHSDLFRAGIARSGAYNRTLTPFGFQAEQRTYWEAPDIYYGMSPFMHADKVDEPILMIHGGADNNSGTFPMQSERFYNALKGLGATARLVMLPYESHGYRARESVLHMLWEEARWLDTYVMNAAPLEAAEADETSPVDAGGE